MFGVQGGPGRCYDRYINKLFDQRRQKSKECGNFNGCDVDYSHDNLERQLYLGVGSYTIGAIKVLNEETARESQVLVDEGRSAKRE